MVPLPQGADAQDPGNEEKPTIILNYPTGGEALHGMVEIRWNTLYDKKDEVNHVNIRLHHGDDPDLQTFDGIATSAPNNSSFLWDTQNHLDRDNYHIEVSWRNDEGIADYSDTISIVNNPSVGVSFSPEDDKVVKGRSYTISWDVSDPNGNTDYHRISIDYSELMPEGGFRMWDDLVSGMTNTSSWVWDTTSTKELVADSDNAAIRVRAESPRGKEGVSDIIGFRVRINDSRSSGESDPGWTEKAGEWLRGNGLMFIIAMVVVLGIGVYIVRAYRERKSVDELVMQREARKARKSGKKHERRSDARKSRKGRGRGRRQGGKGRRGR
jgi:hypothetical protein